MSQVRANTPPSIENIVIITDITRRITNMGVMIDMINGASAGGRYCMKLILPTEIMAIINPIEHNALSEPVIMFRTPAVVGIQVLCTLASISNS